MWLFCECPTMINTNVILIFRHAFLLSLFYPICNQEKENTNATNVWTLDFDCICIEDYWQILYTFLMINPSSFCLLTRLSFCVANYSRQFILYNKGSMYSLMVKKGTLLSEFEKCIQINYKTMLSKCLSIVMQLFCKQNSMELTHPSLCSKDPWGKETYIKRKRSQKSSSTATWIINVPQNFHF